MKFLRSVVNIHQKKIIKKKILDKAVLVKTLLVRYDQILDLEGSKFTYHISILIISMGYQDVFQLIIITDLKVLKSLDKLAVRLGFYKSLISAGWISKSEKVDASTLPSVSMTQNSVLDISLSPSAYSVTPDSISFRSIPSHLLCMLIFCLSLSIYGYFNTKSPKIKEEN